MQPRSPTSTYPKDGINDHVVSGAAIVNPARRGTKCAAWYRVAVASGSTVELRLLLRPAGSRTRRRRWAPTTRKAIAARRAEADEFYAEVTPEAASPDEAMVLRQALSGVLWSKQLYYYDVARWLNGDPAQPAPPASRLTGRNARWRNFDAFDVMSMPTSGSTPTRN